MSDTLPSSPKKSAADERAERLAAQLRANLRKRKQQNRERVKTEQEEK